MNKKGEAFIPFCVLCAGQVDAVKTVPVNSLELKERVDPVRFAPYDLEIGHSADADGLVHDKIPAMETRQR
jgi:hypothetical protein